MMPATAALIARLSCSLRSPGTKQGRAHGTAGGGGGAGTYSEPDTDEESEEESEWEEEGEHGAWEDGPPRAAAPERDK